MAEPGGICISLKVREEIRDNLSYELDDLGEVEVKNIRCGRFGSNSMTPVRYPPTNRQQEKHCLRDAANGSYPRSQPPWS